MKKAKYFITCGELTSIFSQPIVGINELHPERLRPLLELNMRGSEDSYFNLASNSHVRSRSLYQLLRFMATMSQLASELYSHRRQL